MKNLDPRTKIIIVLCISTLSILIENLLIEVVLIVIAALMVTALGGNVFQVAKKVRRLIFTLLGIMVIQSLFIKEGYMIIGIFNFKILTDIGLVKGLQFFLRMCIIILSGSILSTSNIREITQGLIEWRLPYDLVFMVTIGIRFLPIFMEEMKDTVTAIQLRGIDIKSLKLKEKLDLYAYILTPIVVGTLTKAQKLSLSIEARGFRAFDKRTSILELKLAKSDYFLMLLSITISISIVYYSIIGGI